MTQQGWSGRAIDVECLEQFELLGRCLADAAQVLVAELDAVLLQAPQNLQRGLGAVRGAVGFEAHAHDAVEHQGEEADQRVGTNAIG